MPIASERQSSLNVGLMANAVPNTIAAPKPVSDFMDAFRSGFITVDDINKRTRQNVAETDQLKTALAAGDLQRKQIGQAAELSPVTFELTKGKMEADKIKQQLEAAKLNEALVMQTGTPEEQKALMEKTQQLTDQAEYIKNYGRLPDTFTLPQQQLPPFEQWLKASDYNDTLQAIDEAEKGESTSPTAGMLDQNGQPMEPMPSEKVGLQSTEQVARRAEMKAQTLKEAKAVYDQLNAERRKGETVKRGTPEYFKALRDKLESFRSQQSQKEVMLKAAPNILEQEAKLRTEEPKRKAAEEQQAASNLGQTIRGDKVLENNRNAAIYADSAQSLINEPDIQTNVSKQKALMYQVIKAWDSSSAVREGEIGFMAKSEGLKNQLYNLEQNIVGKGSLLAPDQISNLRGMLTSLRQNHDSAFRQKWNEYQNTAKKAGISDETFRTLIPPLPSEAPKTTPSSGTTTAATPRKVLAKNANNVEIVEGLVYTDGRGNKVRAMSDPSAQGGIRWEPVQ